MNWVRKTKKQTNKEEAKQSIRAWPYFKEDAQNSKAIRWLQCLRNRPELALVPVNQVQLKKKKKEKERNAMKHIYRDKNREKKEREKERERERERERGREGGNKMSRGHHGRFQGCIQCSSSVLTPGKREACRAYPKSVSGSTCNLMLIYTWSGCGKNGQTFLAERSDLFVQEFKKYSHWGNYTFVWA